MSTLPPVLPNVGVDVSSGFDGIYWGLVLSTVLFGITIVQNWIYINNNKDGWILRSLVAILFLLDFATTCFDAQIVHHYLVSNFGNLANLFVVSRIIDAELATNVIIVFFVQLFFAYRVYMLNNARKFIAAGIIVTALAALVFGLVTVADQLKHDDVAYLSSRSMKLAVGLTNGLSAISDILTTVTMSWELSRARGAFKRTNTVLQKLFVYIVARGVVVTVAQILVLIMYLVQPGNLHWMPVHLSLCKLYVITMVTMLNSRTSLRADLGHVITDSSMFTASTVAGSRGTDRLGAQGSAIEFTRLPAKGSFGESSEPQKVVGIHITREQIIDRHGADAV